VPGLSCLIFRRTSAKSSAKWSVVVADGQEDGQLRMEGHDPFPDLMPVCDPARTAFATKTVSTREPGKARSICTSRRNCQRSPAMLSPNTAIISDCPAFSLARAASGTTPGVARIVFVMGGMVL